MLRLIFSSSQSHQRIASNFSIVASSNRLRIGFAGTPPTMVYGGTFPVTTARVPMMAPSPDRHAGHNNGFIADPNVIADHSIALVVPGVADIFRIQIPFVKEDGEGVGRKRFQRMVSAGEQEFCAAGRWNRICR